MKIHLIGVLAAAMLALQPSAVMAQAQPIPSAASPGIASKLIVRTDLRGLQVADLRSQMRNDIMLVQAEVYNFGPSDQRLYYRFRWVDAGGMQVGDGEVWKPVNVLGHQTQYLKGTGPSPKATDFFIEMSAEPR